MPLTDYEPPPTTAAQLAGDVVAAFSSAALVNHSRRSYVFAVSLAEREGLQVDHELLYVATMLHDLALEPEFDNAHLGFEVAGGHVAWVFAAGAGWPTVRRTRAAEIIVAHMYDTDPAADPEGYALAEATSLDIGGERLAEWPRELIEATVTAFPRHDLAREFTACFTHQAERKPHTRAATSVRNGIARRLLDNPLEMM